MGAGFDSSAMAPQAPDARRESGFGTYMIFRSVDDVRYYRDQRGRNCVSLTKHRNNGQKGIHSDGNDGR
jgi:anti-sigma regulatory factor (Ser/Thr protein kinase)